MIYLIGIILFFHGFGTMFRIFIVGIIEMIVAVLIIEEYEKKKDQ